MKGWRTSWLPKSPPPPTLPGVFWKWVGSALHTTYCRDQILLVRGVRFLSHLLCFVVKIGFRRYFSELFCHMFEDTVAYYECLFRRQAHASGDFTLPHRTSAFPPVKTPDPIWSFFRDARLIILQEIRDGDPSLVKNPRHFWKWACILDQML